nr:PREDICTED: uncharacterized protein LOC105663648 isoform X1 [Megachile rotundata]
MRDKTRVKRGTRACRKNVCRILATAEIPRDEKPLLYKDFLPSDRPAGPTLDPTGCALGPAFDVLLVLGIRFPTLFGPLWTSGISAVWTLGRLRSSLDSSLQICLVSSCCKRSFQSPVAARRRVSVEMHDYIELRTHGFRALGLWNDPYTLEPRLSDGRREFARRTRRRRRREVEDEERSRHGPDTADPFRSGNVYRRNICSRVRHGEKRTRAAQICLVSRVLIFYNFYGKSRAIANHRSLRRHFARPSIGCTNE